MPCDTRLKKGQKISGRIAEIKKVVATLSSALAAGRVKAVIGPQGAIAFAGLTDQERDGVTDACAYRRLIVEGSAKAKAAIALAEAKAGRNVNKQALAAGIHSHDGGHTFHHGHHKG